MKNCMETTQLQKRVIEAARKELLKSGIKKVCVDTLEPDHEIEKDFQGAVDSLVCDTLFHEGVELG